MPKDLRKFGGIWTICEYHRDIYRRLLSDGYTEDAHVIKQLKKSFDLAKKMNQKLRQLKSNYDDNWYAEHKLDGGEIHERSKVENVQDKTTEPS
jgi:hypothetical protein